MPASPIYQGLRNGTEYFEMRSTESKSITTRPRLQSGGSLEHGDGLCTQLRSALRTTPTFALHNMFGLRL